MISKKLVFAGMMSIGLLLSGCGAETANQSSEGSNETQQKEEKLTAEEVLTKASEAGEAIQNFEMDINMDMTMEADGETINTKSKMLSQMSVDPMFLYQQIDMTMEDMNTNMEMYITQDEMYLYSPEEGAWIKMPNEAGELLTQAQTQQNAIPTKQLEDIQKFTEDLTLTEKDNTYEVVFDGDGEALKEFALEIALQNLDQSQAEQLKQSMDLVTFEDIMYQLSLNKETFYPEALIMDLTMTIEENGTAVKTTINLDTKYSKYNELTNLVVPEDVQQNAVEIPMEEMPVE